MPIMSASNSSAVSPINVYYQREALPRLVAKTVYYNLASKKFLKSEAGRTYTWTLGGLQAADTVPNVDGIPVTPTNVNSLSIVAQTQEYASAVSASSLVQNTAVVDVDQFLLDQITQGGAYTVDALIRNEVFNSASVANINLFAANNRASINSLVTGDNLGFAEIRKLHYLLKNNNVPTFKGGKYNCVISVAQEYDVTNATTGGGFLDLAKQNPEGIKDIKEAFEIDGDGDINVLGTYNGMNLFSTTLNPITNNGTVNVAYAAAWGESSLAAVELESEKFKIFRKTGKEGGTYDITENIGIAMGYKLVFAAKNLSQDLSTLANQRVFVMGSASTF